MKTFKNLLVKLDACREAKEWASNKPIEEIVFTCHRGDWLLWLARKLDVDFQLLTHAKAKCAKTVIHLMKDERSKKAVEVAEAFGLGKATREELNSASAAAYAAYAGSADAYAAYAASAAAHAGSAAAYAADAADAAAYAAADARTKNQLQTAEICREILGDLIIEKVNNLLK